MKFLRHIIHEIVVTIVPKSLRKNMLSCKDVAFILATNPSLPLLKKLKLNMHILICQSCLNYQKQLILINNETKKLNKVKLTEEQMDIIKRSKEDQIKRLSNK